MTVNTLLLAFRLPGGHTQTQGEIEKLVIDELEEQERFGRNVIQKICSDGDAVSLFKGPLDMTLTLRRYIDQDLVTVTIEYFLRPGQVPLLTYNVNYKKTLCYNTPLALPSKDIPKKECKILEDQWYAHSRLPKNVKTLPRVLRGLPFDVYFPTTDERLLEYDVDEVCFDSHSIFQHVQIFKTKTFGNMLVLDDDPNLAESDGVYTESLMRRGTENYANSEVLILGGGDGALLSDLLKEEPRKVIMLEIDDTVMEACKTHLRSLCGTALDQLSGPNYEIMTTDCLPIMSDMLERGTQFDFVFGDLTTIPLTSSNSSVTDIHDFISKVLGISFKLLRPDGKFMTHGPGTSGPESVAMLENLIHANAPPGHSIEISKNSVFVPSFSENWTFYVVQFTKL